MPTVHDFFAPLKCAVCHAHVSPHPFQFVPMRAQGPHHWYPVAQSECKHRDEFMVENFALFLLRAFGCSDVGGKRVEGVAFSILMRNGTEGLALVCNEIERGIHGNTMTFPPARQYNATRHHREKHRIVGNNYPPLNSIRTHTPSLYFSLSHLEPLCLCYVQLYDPFKVTDQCFNGQIVFYGIKIAGLERYKKSRAFFY